MDPSLRVVDRILQFFSGGECEDRDFAFSCALLDQVQTEWKRKYGLWFTEVKFLIAHPGTWIRPHTADTNQQLKVSNLLDLSVRRGCRCILV